ncbi:hypothetical protein HYC85_009356 [Camellia sinensis]|uniref:Uncharacterized protein n=1 Tax=Camellia sinensis TaxID=4442 RepID=A0A7J7HEQ8_CAMSI|nr:hypothetical protein HYC85_009356 [Camellia sinensis]
MKFSLSIRAIAISKFDFEHRDLELFFRSVIFVFFDQRYKGTYCSQEVAIKVLKPDLVNKVYLPEDCIEAVTSLDSSLSSSSFFIKHNGKNENRSCPDWFEVGMSVVNIPKREEEHKPGAMASMRRSSGELAGRWDPCRLLPTTPQRTASMKKGVDSQIPNYPNLPSKLLCLLHNVTLHADLEMDEVYAQMTLQPVPSFDKDALLRSDLSMKANKPQTEFFCKTLTASDTSTHGSFNEGCII